MTTEEAPDPYLAVFRASRKSPAVLKTKLATLRTALPKTPIFALEGIDDKPIYVQWTKRLRPEIDFEPFPCGGKKYVLMLMDVLRRDLSGLSDNIYFFVDRDFDDLGGRASSDDVFMTERYSTENYLVSESVLEQVLVNELHCHAEPHVRAAIVQCFRERYEEFVSATKELNVRALAANRLDIEVLGGLPNKIGKIANVELGIVSSLPHPAETLVKLAAEPTAEELSTIRTELDQLEPYSRFRGKFALAFFLKWLQLLSIERVARATGLFSNIEAVAKVQYEDLSLGLLATRSALPEGLGEFLAQVPAPN